MKLKELKRTVNVCWSPTDHYPVTIAAGSAAQQVDASFSSTSYLELYSLNLEDSGSDLELINSFQTQQKFQKIVWSGSEVIVGGCDGGLLQFYSSEKLLNKSPDCLLGSSTKHNGNVSALDINPYQKNLLASGASESEIFIWDLNNTSQPMAPGNRSQPYDHVQGLAWNQQVQHILGSTFSSRCVVWDLRKNEPIMKLSDSQSRSRWRSLAWHPGVATQLCIASEDDQVPVIQLWDLRLAASPLVTLENHHKGVMALSWCRADPDLLLSAGKDGRVLCWNPNDTQPGGALLAEVSAQAQCVCDVSWSPRTPALLATSSFDQVHVYSLLAGSRPETSSQSASNIMDSFGGVASFSQLPAVARTAAPTASETQLPHAPRWLKRPVAAKFAFGGKLVTFGKPQEGEPSKQVYISQVVSEPEIVERAVELDAVLGAALSADPAAAEQLAEYCRSRGDAASEQAERYTWFFLRASFLPTFKTEALNLLGFKQDEIPSKFKSPPGGDAALSRGESTETEAELSTDTSTDLSEAQTLIERKLSNLELETNVSNVVIPNGEDPTSVICRALVCGNLEEAVELCLDAGRLPDALVIASLGSPELLSRVQAYHLSTSGADPVALLGAALLRARWDALVRGAAPSAWRHVLAALLTHTQGEELAHYAEMLGDKLSAESSPALAEAATVCYLVAMSPDAMLGAPPRDVSRLARDAALALLARRAAAQRGRQLQSGGSVERTLRAYAGRLAAQGCLRAALAALTGSSASDLTHRLQRALGDTAQYTGQQQQQQQQPQYGRTRTVSSHSHAGSYNNASTYKHGVEPRYEQPWQGQPPVAAGWAPQPAPVVPLPPIQPLQPTPPQPPRPGSVGPQGGLTSRGKYKVDPSVQASPLYNQYGFNNNPITSQPTYGYNSPLPDQYQNSSVPNTFAPINPGNPGLNPVNPTLNPMNPTLNPMNPTLNPTNPTLNPMNPTLNPMNPGLNPVNPVNPSLNPVNPTVNGNYYTSQPTDPVAPAPQKPMQAGWNDPPMVSSSNKPKPEVQSQAPITHPLYGVEPPQHVPLNPAAGQYPGQQYPGQSYPGQQYPGQYEQQYQQQYQQPAAQTYQQQPEPVAAPEPVAKAPIPEQHAVLQAVFEDLRVQCSERATTPQMKRKLEDVQRRLETLYDMLREYKPEPVAAPEPVAKAPIPEQHAVLQAVFEDLRVQCSERATTPQMKRKLEDVQRRLETLYDMLREYKLSEAGLQSLHMCASQIRAGSVAGAASAATSLASGADFAAAAAFLPGLKVLLQLADQLQVFAS